MDRECCRELRRIDDIESVLNWISALPMLTCGAIAFSVSIDGGDFILWLWYMIACKVFFWIFICCSGAYFYQKRYDVLQEMRDRKKNQKNS